MCVDFCAHSAKVFAVSWGLRIELLGGIDERLEERLVFGVVHQNVVRRHARLTSVDELKKKKQRMTTTTGTRTGSRKYEEDKGDDDRYEECPHCSPYGHTLYV